MVEQNKGLAAQSQPVTEHASASEAATSGAEIPAAGERSLWDVTFQEAAEADRRLKRAAFGLERRRVTVRADDLRISLHEKGLSELSDEVVGYVRKAAKDVTGGNCAFVDDDLAILAHLARRAVEAGLTDGLSPAVAQSAVAALSSEAPSLSPTEGSASALPPDEPIPIPNRVMKP